MIIRKSSAPYTGTRIPQLIKRPYYTAFNPNSITGLQVWLDATDPVGTGTKPANSSVVTTWYDKSGNGKHATSTGSPTYNTTGLNSLPTVVFSGSQYFLGSVTNSGSTLSAFVVTTITTSLPRTGDLYIMTLGASGISGFSNAAYYGVAKVPTTTTTIGSFRNGALSSYSGISANSPFIASSIVSGSNSILYVTGTPGSTVSTSGNFTITQYALGSDTLTSAGIFIGAISEVLLYSTALSVTEQQTIESYLAQKWAVTASLPTNHRNFSRPAGMPATTRAPLSILSLLSSGFMSTVYNLSTYSLVNIADNVASGTPTGPTYIWSVAVPSGAKGKNGILAIFFNLFSSGQFAANQFFDYGIYVDSVIQMLGDSTGTIRYVQTALGTYAMSSAGISLGLNGLVNGFPLLIPLSFSSSASIIQIGLKNSSAQMTPTSSQVIMSSSNITASNGTINTANYIPINTFSNIGTSYYTVPTTVSPGSAVTGVFIYCWGAGGSDFGSTDKGGTGGFAGGFYSVAGGTVLAMVVGRVGQASSPSIAFGGGGASANVSGKGGGGFSGVFLSNAGGIVQSNAIVIAGGGGACGQSSASGGYGGYTSGGSTSNWSPACTGGTQTGGGIGNGQNGSALQGGNGQGTYGNGGGGGWYGGGANTDPGAWSPGGGGSSYIGNINGATGGVGLTSGAVNSNGMTYLNAGSPNPLLPGGTTSAFYPAGSTLGRNNASGLVVIVPAVGTASTQIGVSATLFSG